MQQIIQYLDKQADEVVQLQSSLVSIPALGPSNEGRGEKEKADFVHKYLRACGFEEIIEINAPDQRVECGYRPNLAAWIRGRDAGRTLWIISHLDIVPPGDLSLWKSDPYSLEVDVDTLIGRGVEDNHQSIVSSVLAARAFMEQGVKPDINLGLLFVADEETGNDYGLPYVLDNRKDLFEKDDLFLVPDFGTSDSTMMEVAEKSMLWLKVSVKGRQCHASTPEKGINSLAASAAFILQLERLHEIFPGRNDLFSPAGSTFCPTKKEANVPNINTIPGLDVFYLDCRILAEYSIQDVINEARNLGSDIEKKYGVHIDYEVVYQQQAAPHTDPSSEVVQRLARGIEKVYQVKPEPRGVGGGTVAAFLRHRGYSAVVWATLTGTAHQPNERSSIASTLKDAQVMALMAINDETG